MSARLMITWLGVAAILSIAGAGLRSAYWSIYTFYPPPAVRLPAFSPPPLLREPTVISDSPDASRALAFDLMDNVSEWILDRYRRMLGRS